MHQTTNGLLHELPATWLQSNRDKSSASEKRARLTGNGARWGTVSSASGSSVTYRPTWPWAPLVLDWRSGIRSDMLFFGGTAATSAAPTAYGAKRYGLRSFLWL